MLMNAKKNAARKAADLIREGMTVGLGSGSTANFAIQEIGQRVKQGLKITAVATSIKSETLAKSVGIPVLDPQEVDRVDIALDGADEVDKKGNLMKGGGGSLLREKVIAFASKRFYAMVDESKVIEKLGKRALPVEIVPFAARLTLRHIQLLGGAPVLRQLKGKHFMSDNGNLVADCRFGEIEDPAGLDIKLKLIPGVVDTGLFLSQIVSGIFIGYENKETRFIELDSGSEE